MTEPVYSLDISVRFRDLDPMGHVNNAVQFSYIEQARAGYFADIIGEMLHEVDTVLVHGTMDFKAPITWENDISVTIDTVDVGRTSITMEYTIVADGRPASTARTVQVVVDDDGDSRPVPDAWVERMFA